MSASRPVDPPHRNCEPTPRRHNHVEQNSTVLPFAGSEGESDKHNQSDEETFKINLTILFSIIFKLALVTMKSNKVNADFFPLYPHGNITENELLVYEFTDDIESVFNQLNAEVLRWNQLSAIQQWAAATGEGADRSSRLEFMQARTKWHNKVCRLRLTDTDDRSVRRRNQDRMLYLLCRGPLYSPSQAREMLLLSEAMGRLYAETKVCRGPRFQRCLNVEPELDRMMRTSTDPAELLWAWVEWRAKIGPQARRLYPGVIHLMNVGARSNGFSDIGEAWRDELEADDLESLVDELYEDIRPLFRKLHTYVRAKLSVVYDFDSSSGLIPAHLLGNMWAQEWSAVLPLVLNSSLPDLNSALRARNYTAWDLLRRAEDFYVSLGLPSMPPKFWTNSRIVKREGGNSNCHGTAANMYTGDDFRLMMCADVTWEDFHVMHHELGHIQYFMAYSDKPPIFQAGANSAFHEAVGEAVMLGVQSPLHLARLGLLSGNDDDAVLKDLEIPLLLKTALNKVPQIVFGMMMDKWRWMVMRGDVTPRRYNEAWWRLHREYLGVGPPVMRSERDFDPAAKFHIMDNTPYIRYFLSGFLQMQFFESMCIATIPNQTELPFPVHRCDIYGNKEAGQLLKKMMALGSSVGPKESLATVTRGRYLSYSAKPLMEYFRPLIHWLDRQLGEVQAGSI